MDQEIKKHAMKVFRFSMRRAQRRCPRWARTPEFERLFLRIYYKAARRNLTGFRSRQNGCGWQVDHIMPLHGENICGLHVPWNLHVVPSIVNQAKSTLIVEQWHRRPSDRQYTHSPAETRTRQRQAKQQHNQERQVRRSALRNPAWEKLF
jgi:hypothetical protein